MLTLAVSDTATALRVGLSVEGVTLYLFWLGTVAMGAGALYFWLMMGTVAKSYRSVMVVAGIICAVACFHYFRMSAIYLEQVAGLFGVSGQRVAGDLGELAHRRAPTVRLTAGPTRSGASPPAGPRARPRWCRSASPVAGPL